MTADEIKALRKEKNLTQEELGAFCGVNKASVSKWEKGLTSPSGSSLIQLQRLQSGEVLVTRLTELEVKLLDDNVKEGGFDSREDYLTTSLRHLKEYGKFLSFKELDQVRRKVTYWEDPMPAPKVAEDTPQYGAGGN